MQVLDCLQATICGFAHNVQTSCRHAVLLPEYEHAISTPCSFNGSM